MNLSPHAVAHLVNAKLADVHLAASQVPRAAYSTAAIVALDKSLGALEAAVKAAREEVAAAALQ